MHLTDASAMLNRHLPEWPPTFKPRDLAALLAGGWREKAACAQWRRRIDDAMRRGLLADALPAAAPAKPAAGDDWLQTTIARAKQAADIAGRAEISRAAAARWLHALGEDLSPAVLAWLGDERLAPTQTPKAVDDWKLLAREIGQKWMAQRERETGKRPTVGEIAKAVEGECMRQRIQSNRGDKLLADYIARAALTGITGRKRGDNLKRRRE